MPRVKRSLSRRRLCVVIVWAMLARDHTSFVVGTRVDGRYAEVPLWQEWRIGVVAVL